MHPSYRIMCGWMKLGEMFDILSDKRFPMNLKSKVYSSVIRPTIYYIVWNVGW